MKKTLLVMVWAASLAMAQIQINPPPVTPILLEAPTPIYTSARLSLSTSPQSTLLRRSSRPTTGGVLVVAVMQSPLSMEQVLEYYRLNLHAQGWQLQSERMEGDLAHLELRQGITRLQLSFSQQGQQVSLRLSLNLLRTF